MILTKEWDRPDRPPWNRHRGVDYLSPVLRIPWLFDGGYRAESGAFSGLRWYEMQRGLFGGMNRVEYR